MSFIFAVSRLAACQVDIISSRKHIFAIVVEDIIGTFCRRSYPVTQFKLKCVDYALTSALNLYSVDSGSDL